MPLIGSLLSNLGFESGPLGADHGYSWANDSITVTRFDTPDYALNATHRIEFLDEERFSLRLDDVTILEGRVGEAATDAGGLYRVFIQSKNGPSASSFSVTRLDRLSAIGARKRYRDPVGHLGLTLPA